MTDIYVFRILAKNRGRNYQTCNCVVSSSDLWTAQYFPDYLKVQASCTDLAHIICTIHLFTRLSYIQSRSVNSLLCLNYLKVAMFTAPKDALAKFYYKLPKPLDGIGPGNYSLFAEASSTITFWHLALQRS